MVAVHYEFQIRMQSGEPAFVLNEALYHEKADGSHKPGDYHFYREAQLGSDVRGSYSYWEELQINVIHTIRLN
ncbi:MAG: hypothetical protein KDD39_11170 [Bdellovibrionales bacterium]|nr:hypothetical protein [Bdellovibrionales bacterium]